MSAQVDPSNLLLLGQHAACAAVEAPLLPSEDAAFFGPNLAHVVANLASSGGFHFQVLDKVSGRQACRQRDRALGAGL